VCIVVCDGLKGLPEAISNTWPLAITQTCVLHLVRNTFRFASKADWDPLARDLRPVYTAISEADAKERFVDFTATWGEKYPAIVRLWENAWTEFVPFLDYSPEIRKVIYSTDEIVKGQTLVSVVASERQGLRRPVPPARRGPSRRLVAA
jgi:putative transposase